jgi:aspartyl-tRNA(Asn)/glutamyl-tRNA(Gln) amidotransferase subunit A
MNHNEICFMPAVDLARAIRRRDLRAVEVVEAFLVRIREENPRINAYVTLSDEQALEDARAADAALDQDAEVGVFHGVPFSAKDLILTAGVRTTSGSRIYENFVPSIDSLSVSRLRAAGAILLGKTNTPEFGYKATTENQLFGTTKNPWNLAMTSGGSSGGAGAATAAGLSPLSLGTDGGGSIRIPASFCGVFGFKATFGRVPTLPGLGGWRSLSHTGPITRTVRDAAVMLDVIAGTHESDRTSIPGSGMTYESEVLKPRKGLKLGYSPDLGYAHLDAEVGSVVERAVGLVGGMGHNIERADVYLRAAMQIFETIAAAENAGAHSHELKQHRDIMDSGLVKFIERGAEISILDYMVATRHRDDLAAALANYFASYDLLLTPTVAVPPFPIDEMPREIAGNAIGPLGWIPFTFPFNLTGNPAASLPCGYTSLGLPVGLQVVGPRHADDLVLNFCAQFESAFPWAGRRPD